MAGVADSQGRGECILLQRCLDRRLPFFQAIPLRRTFLRDIWGFQLNISTRKDVKSRFSIHYLL